MRNFGLKFLIPWSRVIVGLSLFSTFVFACQLVGMALDVPFSSDKEVRLCLDTRRPNMFSATHAVKSGFENGKSNNLQPPRQLLLPRLQASTTGFELTANPQAPVLRYQEPNPWKRLALLLLGASDDLFSLSWILLLGIGSWQLWRLLLDVTPATPFALANSRRLATVALLVLSLNLAEEISYVAVRSLMPDFHAPGLVEPLSHYVQLSTENTLPNVMVGIMLAIIAAVYRRGVELSQEAELVI
jgi:Protein of unknown function (DUF2975)